LIIAVLLALGTGFLTLNYLNSLRNASQAAGQPRPVLVAVADIPARATITQAMLQTVQRPSSVVEPDALSDPTKAVGSIALITIPAGSTITASRVGSIANAALPVRLAPGMRAVSIAIDKVKGVSGLAQPGDRVDVIAILPRTQGQTVPRARTFLRGVRILALGSILENTSATPSPEEQNSQTVTLEVTPKQADLLAAADVNTTLRLALRSPKESLRSEPIEAFDSSDFGVAQSQPQPQTNSNDAFAGKLAEAFGRAAASNAAPPKSGAASVYRPGPVQIIDGDHIATASGN
jgi:pilus assembly protein CpaB